MEIRRPSSSLAVKLGEFGRFVAVGSANTLIVWCVYWSALLAVPYQAAFALSFIVGVLFSAWAHSRVSFGLRLGRKGLLYYAIYCVFFYVFSAGLLEALIRGFGVPPAWGNVWVTLIGLPVNFLGSRLTMKRQAMSSH